jgi:hypothetical protein
MTQPAKKPVMPEGVPSVIDFPRDIQPILDRHCVECHSADRMDGRVDLTGDKTAMYTMSYWAMQQSGLVVDGRNQPDSNYEPYRFGSASSKLMQYIAGSHHDVKVTDHERDMIRLWLDTSATYPGTYASLGCGSTYAYLPYNTPQFKAKCAECHWKDSKDNKGNPIKRWFFGRGHRATSTEHGTSYNLTRPEKSMLLLAPLAKEAGGLQLCGEPLFKDKSDPGYQLILQRIQEASGRLQRDKRFDMPGFRPNVDYIREMQRFGFIPKDLGENDPVDPYAVDKAYWDSFYFDPAQPYDLGE